MKNEHIHIRVHFPAIIHIDNLKSGSDVEIPVNTTIEELLTRFQVKKEHQRYLTIIVDGEKSSLSHILQNREELRLILPAGGG